MIREDQSTSGGNFSDNHAHIVMGR